MTNDAQFRRDVDHMEDTYSVQTFSCLQETQASNDPPKMITYVRRRSKGSKGQGSVQQVADLPGENGQGSVQQVADLPGEKGQGSVQQVADLPGEKGQGSVQQVADLPGEKGQGSVQQFAALPGEKGQGSLQQVADLPGENLIPERAQPGVRTVVIGLQAASQVSSGPQPKRSKGRVGPVKTSNSGVVAASQVSGDCQPKGAKGRVEPRNASSSGREQSRRPQERKNHKRVAADSPDSEKTTTRVSRAHRQARRTSVRNGRQEGKLDDEVLNKYLGNLWQTIPSEKKASCAYIDCLWYVMYHKGDREKALKWIKSAGIFSKKYVFLPICEYNHWSLLIFCHLGEDLKSKTSTPCMLLLDSLRIANAKENLEKDIRSFLLSIYEDEGKLESTKQIDKIPLLVPKVPQQTGDKECGYYVLYYITLFLRSCPETFSISNGYPYFMVENWFPAEEVESFRKTLPSPQPETGPGNDLSDGGSDDVMLIER
ncbi:ubiquitin-like protease 4 [Heracleum sosnowskyi]|uniref:Ubiquitin-like protease 4 n=1 Tax=Heracleum sosnowskyi TaxID=360622 RepID=A0AAD8HB36_9APIA|nr:ubiquitin-like protease 4 [Heracleum sosnowskyi]